MTLQLVKDLVEHTETACPVCDGKGRMRIADYVGIRKKMVSVRCTACLGKRRIPLVLHNRGWVKTERSAFHHYVRSRIGETTGKSLCNALKAYSGTVTVGYEGEDRCPRCKHELSKLE